LKGSIRINRILRTINRLILSCLRFYCYSRTYRTRTVVDRSRYWLRFNKSCNRMILRRNRFNRWFSRSTIKLVFIKSVSQIILEFLIITIYLIYYWIWVKTTIRVEIESLCFRKRICWIDIWNQVVKEVVLINNTFNMSITLPIYECWVLIRMSSINPIHSRIIEDNIIKSNDCIYSIYYIQSIVTHWLCNFIFYIDWIR